LNDQPKNFRLALASVGIERNIQAGSPLYHAGDTGSLFGVVSGCIAISVVFTCSPHTALHFAYPGYFIGQRPITVGLGYAVSARARVDSKVVELPLPGLRKLVEAEPEWWRCLANLNSYWFDVAACSMVDMLIRDPGVRCVAVLLRLGGFRPFPHMAHAPSKVPVTQTELATNANLSRSRVSETLAQLERDGLIRRGYGDIEILLPEALAAIVERDLA